LQLLGGVDGALERPAAEDSDAGRGDQGENDDVPERPHRATDQLGVGPEADDHSDDGRTDERSQRAVGALWAECHVSPPSAMSVSRTSGLDRLVGFQRHFESLRYRGVAAFDFVSAGRSVSVRSHEIMHQVRVPSAESNRGTQ
jgi:hypothetical protein